MSRHNHGRSIELEREFANALSWEVAQSGTFSFRGVSAHLRRLEHSFTSRLRRDRNGLREVRRRIAEQMLQQAIAHNCSLQTCRVKLNTLSEVGFANVERKAHFHLL